MKLVADSRGRLTSAELFKPGTAFDVSRNESDGSIVLRKLIPQTERRVLAKMSRTKSGFKVELPPGIKVAETAIEEAIREERDSR